tara:strand:- start:790 stop:1020 length:231 start_codon:yes stop_codon:yes gene_type:complete
MIHLGFVVEVYPCRDGDWRHDTVFIYHNDTKRLIAKREVGAILQYLYDEGYIQDRRTKYEIVDSSGGHDKQDENKK